MKKKNIFLIFLLFLFLFSCNKGSESNNTNKQESQEKTESENKVAKEDEAKEVESQDGDSLPDLQGIEIQAVTENGYVPLNYEDPETGNGVGFEYDLVNEIGNRLNATIIWNISSWDTMINSVKEGQFDVGMNGITITDERKQEIDFSIPYLKSEQFMLVRSDEERFMSHTEFKANQELIIGSQLGTTQFYTAVYNILDGNEESPRIKAFDNFAFAVQALISGDVDMVLMDKVSSEGYIGANEGQLKLVGSPIGTEFFGLIFTKGSKYLEPFNKAIQSMLDDKSIEELEKKWYAK